LPGLTHQFYVVVVFLATIWGCKTVRRPMLSVCVFLLCERSDAWCRVWQSADKPERLLMHDALRLSHNEHLLFLSDF